MLDKAALRGRLRRARRDFVAGLSEGARSDLHIALAERVCPLLPADAIVASYVATGSEIDPRAIDRRAGKAGTTLAYPWFADRDAAMLFRRGDSFVDGPFAFAQPDANAPLLVPDIVLVPLIAADARGNRLGQGAGHYDRALSALLNGKILFTIGLAYDIQIVDELAPDEWDVPLDAIATPGQWIDVLA